MSDAATLTREPVFTALTRPQMFGGVTYNYFILNAVLTMELFLVTRSFWVILVELAVHGIGAALHLREPRIVDLWLLRARRTPRLRSYRAWGCNSYRP